MATHTLAASPETVHWGFFDAGLKPLITVDSSDTVTITSVSGVVNHLPKPDSGLTVPPELVAIHQKVQPRMGGPLLLEVHDLDDLARGQNDPSGVVAMIGLQVHDPRIGRRRPHLYGSRRQMFRTALLLAAWVPSDSPSWRSFSSSCS